MYVIETCVFVCKCYTNTYAHTHIYIYIFMICQPLPVTSYCLIYLSQSHWDRMPHWDDCWILPLRTPQKGTPQTHATHGRIRRRNRLKRRRKNLLSRFLEWTRPLRILAIFPVLPNFHDCRSQTVKFFQSLSAKRNASTMARQVECK